MWRAPVECRMKLEHEETYALTYSLIKFLTDGWRKRWSNSKSGRVNQRASLTTGHFIYPPLCLLLFIPGADNSTSKRSQCIRPRTDLRTLYLPKFNFHSQRRRALHRKSYLANKTFFIIVFVTFPRLNIRENFSVFPLTPPRANIHPLKIICVSSSRKGPLN